MGFDISKIFEDKDKDPRKDITSWPRDVLEIRYKKNKQIFKFAAIGFIILIAMLLWQINENWSAMRDLDSTRNALDVCVSDAIDLCPDVNRTVSSGSSNIVVTGVTDFFKWITHIDQPYFYKIMILLGILYLVQIVFAVIIDIVEVILLIFVLIKRGIAGIIKLFKHDKSK